MFQPCSRIPNLFNYYKDPGELRRKENKYQFMFKTNRITLASVRSFAVYTMRVSLARSVWQTTFIDIRAITIYTASRITYNNIFYLLNKIEESKLKKIVLNVPELHSQVKDPSKFTQRAFASQLSSSLKHSSISKHSVPGPEYPALHVHSHPSSVSVQSAFSSQL